MKKLSLFAMAFAALAFTACTQDDELNPKDGEQPVKGELLDEISINFGQVKASTRAYAGKQQGEGTEGRIYEAFIFAKEANPAHSRPKTGDYTVIRVTADNDGKLITEIGGVNNPVSGLSKDKLTKAINENATADVEWLVKNVATFKGVRQGDYVYVIANDPDLTLAQANEKAHQGADSEKNIREYVAALSKEYLNGLTYRAEHNELPKGRFIMAGREMIPVAPIIPSNGAFTLNIGLERELAKVNFRASVSTSTADEACGNVEFKGDDGIVVARISRKVSPFVNQEQGDWYVPATTNTENWPINDHELVNGVYSKFCDYTVEGSRVFDGTSATPIQNWNKETIPALWNGVAPDAAVTEYRFSWQLNGESEATMADNSNYVYLDAGTLTAPMFYVTPNYSANTNSVTVICTQATYVGRGVFSMADMANKYVDAALNVTTDSITVFTAEELVAIEKTASVSVDADLKKHGLKLVNPLKYAVDANGVFTVDANGMKSIKAAIDTFGIALATQAEFDKHNVGSGSTLENLTYDKYKNMMDRLYVAVLLQQRLADKTNFLVGNNNGGGNNYDVAQWGNGIPTDVKGFFVNAATDSLMLGYNKSTVATEPHLSMPFYIDLTKAQSEADKLLQAVFTVAPSGSTPTTPNAGGKSGAALRAEYFAKTAAYSYAKGDKVYYRADVADYDNDTFTSNKLTERNVYYNTTGTIKSLGAKSIHDAIYAGNNTMSVTVLVKDWTLSMNNVPM